MQDKELIRLCEEVRYARVCMIKMTNDGELARIAENSGVIGDVTQVARDAIALVSSTPPHTRAGLRAKALLYKAIPNDALANSIATDIIRMTADIAKPTEVEDEG